MRTAHSQTHGINDSSNATGGRIRVLVDGSLPDFVCAAFERAFAARYTSTFDTANLTEISRDCDAVVITVNTRVDEKFLSRLDQSVRILATYSVGTDHIDLDAAARSDVMVFNTPDVLTDSVAEIAMFLAIGAARRATESLSLIRGRNWSGWTPTQLIGTQLAEKKMGILGMGRIGRAIAERAKSFRMDIHYFNRSRLPEELERGAEYSDSAEKLFGCSDFLILAAPSNTETRHMLNASTIGHFKEGAIVINIARGGLVDDDALISALKSGAVRAAGLDVFNGEPHVDPRYFELPNVFMLPHIGSSTVEARLGMAKILIDQIAAAEAARS